jgi:hypothetical protein
MRIRKCAVIPQLAFLTLGMWLSSCTRHDGTSKLVGTWGGKAGEIVFSADKSFHSTFTNAIKTWNYYGVWELDNDELVLTITNANAINITNFESIGSVDRVKILKIDKTFLVTEYGQQPGITNFFTRK